MLTAGSLQSASQPFTHCSRSCAQLCRRSHRDLKAEPATEVADVVILDFISQEILTDSFIGFQSGVFGYNVQRSPIQQQICMLIVRFVILSRSWVFKSPLYGCKFQLCFCNGTYCTRAIRKSFTSIPEHRSRRFVYHLTGKWYITRKYRCKLSNSR